jgi:acetyl esterase/lipase
MSSLHPEVRQLVATLATKPPPAPWEVSITAYREAGERLAVLAGLPDDGCAVTELAIPVRGGSVDARHYRPPGGTVCPAVVYLHGGGFVRGSLDSHDRLCRALCMRGGLGVVAVAYRLAPENRFPTAHDDALDALRWVNEHASELSIDPTALAVAGDSSGGTLAAATALAARSVGPPLKAQGLLCPALDATMSSGSVDRYHAGPFLTREGLAWSYDQYVPDADDRRSARVSPLFEETLADAPPSIIISAQIDPVADDARRYAEALAAAGVAVETHEYAGMPHSFVLLAGVLEDGDHALTTLADGLAELLKSG